MLNPELHHSVPIQIHLSGGTILHVPLKSSLVFAAGGWDLQPEPAPLAPLRSNQVSRPDSTPAAAI
jgi:hypothetical protein